MAEQAALLAELEGFPEVREAIDRVWAFADADGSGSIEFKELEAVCRKLVGTHEANTAHFAAQVARLNEILDADRSGLIDVGEFRAGLWRWIKDARDRRGTSATEGSSGAALSSAAALAEIKGFFSQFHSALNAADDATLHERLAGMAGSAVSMESALNQVRRLPAAALQAVRAGLPLADARREGMLESLRLVRLAVMAGVPGATAEALAAARAVGAGGASEGDDDEGGSPLLGAMAHSVHAPDLVASAGQAADPLRRQSALTTMQLLLDAASEWRAAPFDAGIQRLLVSVFQFLWQAGAPAALLTALSPAIASLGSTDAESRCLAACRCAALSCLRRFAEGPCLPHLSLSASLEAPWHPDRVWATTRQLMMTADVPGAGSASGSRGRLPALAVWLGTSDPSPAVRAEAAYFLAALASDPGPSCTLAGGRDAFRAHIALQCGALSSSLARVASAAEPAAGLAGHLCLISVLLGQTYADPPNGVLGVAPTCLVSQGHPRSSPNQVETVHLALALYGVAAEPVAEVPSDPVGTATALEARVHACNAVAHVLPLLGGAASHIAAPLAALARGPLLGSANPLVSAAASLVAQAALRGLSFVVSSAAVPDPGTAAAAGAGAASAATAPPPPPPSPAQLQRHAQVVVPAREATLSLLSPESGFVSGCLAPILETTAGATAAAAGSVGDALALRLSALHLIETAALAALATPALAPIQGHLIAAGSGRVVTAVLRQLQADADAAPRCARILRWLVFSGHKPLACTVLPAAGPVASAVISGGLVPALLAALTSHFERVDPVMGAAAAPSSGAASNAAAAAAAAMASIAGAAASTSFAAVRPPPTPMAFGSGSSSGAAAGAASTAGAAVDGVTVTLDLELCAQVVDTLLEVVCRAAQSQDPVAHAWPVVKEHLCAAKVLPALARALGAVQREQRRRLPARFEVGDRAAGTLLTLVAGRGGTAAAPAPVSLLGVLSSVGTAARAAGPATGAEAVLAQAGSEHAALLQVLHSWAEHQAAIEQLRRAGAVAAATAGAAGAAPAGGLAHRGVLREVLAADFGTPGGANTRVIRISTSATLGMLRTEIDRQFGVPPGVSVELRVKSRISPLDPEAWLPLTSDAQLQSAWAMMASAKFLEVAVLAKLPSGSPHPLLPDPWKSASHLLAATDDDVRTAISREGAVRGAPSVDRKVMTRVLAHLRGRGVAEVDRDGFAELMELELSASKPSGGSRGGGRRGERDSGDFDDEGRRGAAAAGRDRERWDRMFAAMDHDGSGTLDLRELLLGLATLSSGNFDSRLAMAFEAWDADSSGFLTFAELVDLMSTIMRCRHDVAEARASRVLARFDADGDHRISRQEFVEWGRLDKDLRNAVFRDLDFDAGDSLSWQNCLNPSLSKLPWQPEEDSAIFRLRAKLGNKWVEIASHVPGRSDNAVKNRFYSTLRRIARHERISAKEAMSRFEAGSLDTDSIMAAMAIAGTSALLASRLPLEGVERVSKDCNALLLAEETGPRL
ncbi:hypothetical protein FNF29_06024 [Cafeteria roenbergensis]|uniref:Uncharacterized protein n=1 Tax=Cafeteria roenbergensis TaxID=33653 RepID=A0A5A8C9P8_CAFRO|nr:hypothetical protein FNF29_06024 [Cafeteria roenbergensis]|eukprot:KAA0149319.1 hypothetical protein FNF29_06024 [Cafeteria roenbergensis]